MFLLTSHHFARPRQILLVVGPVLLLLGMAIGSPAPVAAEIRVEAYAGQPLGVGRVIVDLPPDGGQAALADDRFVIDDAAGRLLYPAPKRQRVRKVLRSLLGIQLPRKLTYYFLFKGDDPLTVDVYVPNRVQVAVTPRLDRASYDRRFGEWWAAYVELYERIHREAEYPVGVQTYLTAMWAGRLGQSMPRLEGFLIREREQGGSTTGKLLADEAYRASVLRDLMLGELDDPVASQPLPEVQIPVAGLLMPTEEVAIEPIVGRVPEECFYVRFGTFSNYLWFRDFLGRWKGDLGNMLLLRSIRRSSSDQISSMLGLRDSKIGSILGPQVIADVAVVGMDPYFRDGASVGVLFEAKNSFLLRTSLSQQRATAVREVPGAKLTKAEIAGHQVDFLSSPNGRLRSYYATDGEYHLVASSRTMIERFYEAAGGERGAGRRRGFPHRATGVPHHTRRSRVCSFVPSVSCEPYQPGVSHRTRSATAVAGNARCP